jgi:ABC-type transport system substrate-binding protein/class 3 adenylate cyclase
MPDAPELPTGTITFLFTDIEGSTKLLQRLGAGYAAVLATHQRLLRQAWAEHGGAEVDTQGDSFFVVFPRALDALAAAGQAQRALAEQPWPAGEHVRVRMGLHTGEGTLSHGHYVGLDVHRAARIAAAGHGGQVLLSQATRDQVAKELVVGAGLRDLGKHRLKDLPRREEIYQLLLPGMPAEYPPLKTLDAWPGYRADLTVVVLLSAVLLAAVGLALPLVVPSFPRWIGLGATGLAALLLASSVVARPVRRGLLSQWRDARKPVAAATSALLSLVVVSTTLFITKPPIFIGPKHLGYDFSYTYHAPGTHTGGRVTIEFGGPMQALTPGARVGTGQNVIGLWQSCLTLLPNVALGLAAYKPDQCTEVPTVANGGEDPDGKWTLFHIDPRAIWSDGVPITAADYLFADHLYQDPNIGAPFVDFPHRLSQPDPSDPRTLRIDWTAPSSLGDYLGELIRIQPLPLHVYATGPFAGVYDPKSGAYNSALAQQLITSSRYLTQVPVDDGPYTVQSFVPNSHVVLVRNPRFFSNFFHKPVLDAVTLVTVNPHWGTAQGLTGSQAAATLIANFRRGGVGLVDGLSSLDLSRLSGLPKAEVVTSPVPIWVEIGFNQRGAAPNAMANGGTSIFADKNVRKAFIEAFDRCAASRAQLGAVNCSDPNLFTDELTVAPAPDYDPSIKLPGYNPTDAARLMDQAGYPVVDGIRRAKDGATPLQLTIATSLGGARVPLLARRLQQDYMHNLKIAVTLSLAGDLLPNVAAKGAFDIGLYAETGAPDPTFNAQDTALCCTDATGATGIPTAQNPGGGNIFGIVDPLVDQQVQLGLQTPDAAQSANVYLEMQRHWAQQFYTEPMFIEANVNLVQTTLCNFKPFPQFTGNLWNMADWYVAPTCPS